MRSLKKIDPTSLTIFDWASELEILESPSDIDITNQANDSTSLSNKNSKNLTPNSYHFKKTALVKTDGNALSIPLDSQEEAKTDKNEGGAERILAVGLWGKHSSPSSLKSL